MPSLYVAHQHRTSSSTPVFKRIAPKHRRDELPNVWSNGKRQQQQL
jgi:hypothetical protein